jgi:chemotaxis protein CheX
MILHDRIVESIRTSAEQVCSTMLGLELGPGECLIESTPPEAADGVLALIGVAGGWAGTGSVSCSAAMACRVCNQMLMTEAAAVDEEVLDAMAELTNMIVGNVKTDLETDLGALALSIPTVIYGRNFKAKTASNLEWHKVRWVLDGDPLTVRLCLAPQDQAQAHGPHGIAQQCPVPF